MDSSLVYTAGAVWLATLLAYYLLSRRPLYAMPVGGLAVALAFITLYPWVLGWHNQKALLDLRVFEISRQCIVSTVGATASHVSFAAEVILTAASVFAIFTLGLSVAIASILVDAIIDAFNTLIQGITSYLGYAESVLGLLASVTAMLPAFTALGAPLVATFLPDRRGAAVAAAVASIPVVASVPFLLTPPLQPLQCTAEAVIYQHNAAVQVSSNAPLLWLFQGNATQGYNVTVVYGALTSGKLYLPAGNYTVTTIWSFIPFPAGRVEAKAVNATIANVTLANRTAYLPDI
ncbi:MAG: hypothetical protein QXT27_04370, partial [Pyrobaculum sp.]